MNCGEVASNKSTAALASGVSGMRTPANDPRRVIVAITENSLLLASCRDRFRVDDWNESDSDSPAAPNILCPNGRVVYPGGCFLSAGPVLALRFARRKSISARSEANLWRLLG